MSHSSKTEDLFEQLRQAHKTIDAQKKTIDVLTRRALEKQTNRDSAFALLEENSSLQEIVTRKTVEIEEQHQKLEHAHQALKNAQNELIQAQKLESIGRLAAGVAHEINTPIQYISDNINFVKESKDTLRAIEEIFDALIKAYAEGKLTDELVDTLQQRYKRSNIEAISNEIDLALQDSLEGIQRVSKIVTAMKEFSHPGSKEKTVSDINKSIQSTIAITRNEWKYIADLQFIPDTSLKAFPFFISEFNQCILNLIVNSAHAIEEQLEKENKLEEVKGQILITTKKEADWVRVKITDTGTGIPDEIRDRIFDPFFTTKPPGKGTGQGLTFVYSSIVKKHEGSIEIESTEGLGSSFTLRLPISKI